MTNSDAGSDLWPEIVSAISVEYHWPALQPVEKAEVPADTTELRATAGHYRFTVGIDTVPVDITSRGDALRMRLPWWAHERILHRSARWTYFFTEDPAEMTFEVNGTGKVTGAALRTAGQVLHASRQLGS